MCIRDRPKVFRFDNAASTPPSPKSATMRNLIFSGPNKGKMCIRDRLGRPWHNSPIAVYLNTIFNIKIAPEGWTDMGAIPQMFAEYNSKDKEGNTVDLSQRKTQYTYQDEQENPVTGICQAVRCV